MNVTPITKPFNSSSRVDKMCTAAGSDGSCMMSDQVNRVYFER